MSKLLVVIDMQNGFSSKGSEKVVNKLNDNFCKFDHVGFTLFENKKESLFSTHQKWVDFVSDEDQELMSDILTPSASHYIKHFNYTIYNDEFKRLIKELKPSDIYLSGSFSDVCILKTVMDMFDDGVIPYIIMDLSVCPHDDKSHDVAIATMKMAIGEDRIISLNDLS